MNDSAYLIFNKKGIVRLAKGGRTWSRKRPALKAGEYAVLVRVIVPQRYFDERSLPSATLNIPEELILEPSVTMEAEPAGAYHT